MKPALRAAVLVVAALPLGAARAQSPRLDELISKATAYAHEFVARFSNVVAEERYEQTMTRYGQNRVLVSDFLLVKPADDELWQPFRDVAEVDGKPVREREDQLMKLFLQPSSDAMRRAVEIRDAGARYNLANVGTLGNPVLVIALLQKQYVKRFRFNLEGREKELGPDTRRVRFEEIGSPTVLKQGAGKDLSSRGLIWIEEGTGRVVKTELRGRGFRVTTQFAFHDELGINVPAALEERYPAVVGEFTSKATYGRFRRFGVTTQETIRP